MDKINGNANFNGCCKYGQPDVNVGLGLGFGYGYQGGDDRPDCRVGLVLGDYHRKIRHAAPGQAAFQKFEETFWSGGSLDRLYDSIGNRPRDPMSAMFVAAMKEWKRTNIMKSKTDRGLRGVSLQQRIEKAMMVSMDKELDELDTRMGFLASTGSVAPLVGLFGTVWGIINSFNAIAATQSNSLSAMAPGIAEALFTTAFGLIAAIPAVVAYNKISSDIDRYAKRLENFQAEFSSILSREIDDTAIKADMAGE